MVNLIKLAIYNSIVGVQLLMNKLTVGQLMVLGVYSVTSSQCHPAPTAQTSSHRPTVIPHITAAKTTGKLTITTVVIPPCALDAQQLRSLLSRGSNLVQFWKLCRTEQHQGEHEVSPLQIF